MLRNIALIMRGAVFAQALGLLVLPLLSRLYTPDDFGALQYYLSCLVVLGVSINLRFEFALLRGEDGVETDALFRLCLIANVVLSTLMLIAFVLAAQFAPRFYAEYMPFAPWLLPLGVFLYGFALSANNLSLRRFSYALNSNSKVVQSGFNAAGSIAFAFAQVGRLGLVLGDLVGRLAAATFLLIGLRKFNAERPHLADLRAAARRYRAFALISAPSGVINSLGGALTPILIYASFSPAVAGQFGLVERSLMLAVALIVGSVSQVYASQLGQVIREKGDCKELFARLLRWTALLAIGPVLILALFAQPLFVLVFGNEWSQAGVFARVLAPAIFFLLLSGAVNMTLVVLERQGLQMAWEVGRLLLMGAIWSVVFERGLTAQDAVMLHSAALVASSLVFLLLAWKAVRKAQLAIAAPQEQGGPG